MIQKINLNHPGTLNSLYELQLKSYLVEARIVKSKMLPPLLEKKEDLLASDEVFWAIVSAKKIMGAVSVFEDVDFVQICRLFIDPDYFRQGLAKQLLEYVFTQFPNRKIIVSTGSLNEPACLLYESLGFSILERINTEIGVELSVYIKS